MTELVKPGARDVGRDSVLDDAAVLAQLAGGVIRRPNMAEPADRRYLAHVVGLGDRQLDVELSQDGASARTWIALPESLRPVPWLVEWEPADDAGAWVRQLAEWLDEEMYTGGLGPAHARVMVDDQPRLLVDGYGFRLADPVEHQRLRRSVGPHGWHATTRRRLIRRQYAAEWALDQVEQQMRGEPLADLLEFEELEWSLTSPDALSVLVEATIDADQAAQFALTAQLGLRGGLLGRRRIHLRPDQP